jgi:hypothetical protein
MYYIEGGKQTYGVREYGAKEDISFIHSFIHSFCSLSYDRSVASSKASSPLSAI